MALVRCPIHDIPFNDDNPRGCPACAREKEGTGDQGNIMKELARASQMIRRPGPAPGGGSGTHPLLEEIEMVTPQPRVPPAEFTWLDRALTFVKQRPIHAIGIPLVVILLGRLLFRSGPEFVERPHPPAATEEALPLPIEPGQAVSTVFAVLGTQPPRAHPEFPVLERYAYGTDLAIDALNGVVYSIVLGVPSRSWRGLRVGMPQQHAEGALALLGTPQSARQPTQPRADTIAGYVVYPSLEARPRQSLKAEVRPPNGCFDAIVDIQPRAVGIVIQSEREFAAIGPPRTPFDWVATRVTVVNRQVAGPRGAAAC